MTGKVIIDGWNICWKIPELAVLLNRDLSMVRKKLDILLQTYFRNRKITWQVIYDGQPGISPVASHDKKAHVRFSKKPQSADSLILNFLRKQKKAGEWTVISSDRELTGKASQLGARIQSAEDFINRMQTNRRTKQSGLKEEPSLSADEMEFWKKQFGQG